MNNYSVIKTCDEFMTPNHVWNDIQHLIPKKTIWEPFIGDGTSSSYLKGLGFDVVCEKEDFFNNNKGEIIVTNPPFSKKKNVMKQLKLLGKPFIVICPANMLHTRYIQELFKNELQLIVPHKRIQFIQNGKVLGRCNFECLYFCWKIGLPRDVLCKLFFIQVFFSFLLF